MALICLLMDRIAYRGAQPTWQVCEQPGLVKQRLALPIMRGLLIGQVSRPRGGCCFQNQAPGHRLAIRQTHAEYALDA
jgi:hypothetical protein